MMKKVLLSISLVCFLLVPLAMAGLQKALVNSPQSQEFAGYTSSDNTDNGGSSDSDYHSWTGSNGANTTQTGTSTAGGSAKIEGLFSQGQSVYSWLRMEFDPGSGSSPEQDAYGSIDRTFTCATSSEQGVYWVTINIKVELDDLSTANEFSGYVSIDDFRVDFTADKDGLDWDEDNGTTTGTESYTLDGGNYHAQYSVAVPMEIFLNETHTLLHYCDGSGTDGDESECYIISSMIPL